jgi:DNA-binding transcriptional MerR regulator
LARRATPSHSSGDSSGIPDKPYFKIGEAARLCAVKPYVLRYWETEFKSLRPQKTRSQQRLYRRRDVELLLKIRHLLYDKRYTIEGARTRLRELGHDEGPVEVPPAAVSEIHLEALRKLKQGLADLIRICAE